MVLYDYNMQRSSPWVYYRAAIITPVYQCLGRVLEKNGMAYVGGAAARKSVGMRGVEHYKCRHGLRLRAEPHAQERAAEQHERSSTSVKRSSTKVWSVEL